jgi:hypothetical protein
MHICLLPLHFHAAGFLIFRWVAPATAAATACSPYRKRQYRDGTRSNPYIAFVEWFAAT